MGLLNNMLNIIGKGVAKSVSDAVEKAVSEAVKPAAAKLAQKQADLIDTVTQNIEEANKSIQEAGETAGQAVEEAAAQDPEQVKMAMEYLRRSFHKAAEEIEKLEVEKKLSDEEVMARWETLLPDFPKWTCGGNHFSFEEEDIDGEHYVRFYLSAAEASWIAYKGMLLANGFRTKYRGDASTWYKEVDGRYPALNLFHIDYDACEMQIVYYQETAEEIAQAAKL